MNKDITPDSNQPWTRWNLVWLLLLVCKAETRLLHFCQPGPSWGAFPVILFSSMLFLVVFIFLWGSISRLFWLYCHHPLMKCLTVAATIYAETYPWQQYLYFLLQVDICLLVRKTLLQASWNKTTRFQWETISAKLPSKRWSAWKQYFQWGGSLETLSSISWSAWKHYHQWVGWHGNTTFN